MCKRRQRMCMRVAGQTQGFNYGQYQIPVPKDANVLFMRQRQGKAGWTQSQGLGTRKFTNNRMVMA